MDPYGKQADKRKKEVSDLEARVRAFYAQTCMWYCVHMHSVHVHSMSALVQVAANTGALVQFGC